MPGALGLSPTILNGAAATAPHGKRRGQYLLAASAHLVLTLEHLCDEWSPERQDNYRAKLLALPPAEAVKKILAQDDFTGRSGPGWRSNDCRLR